jgi:hypothetical protein
MFDTSLKSNKYKIISDRKDDEIWQLITPENLEGGGGNE